MEFFIKKNATLPYILVKLINDGRSDFRKFLDMDGFTIKFTMKNGEDIKILNKECVIREIDNELYISYQFTKKETKKIGTYFGQFTFFLNEKEFVLPLKMGLIINIVDSFVLEHITNDTTNPYIVSSTCCGSTHLSFIEKGSLVVRDIND